jgi:hypothetical protein
MTSPSGFPGPVNSRAEEKPAAPAAPSGAAQRALAEAQARRLQPVPAPPRELNGRGGLDPARYGDWEVKGIASDF